MISDCTITANDNTAMNDNAYVRIALHISSGTAEVSLENVFGHKRVLNSAQSALYISK